MHQDSKTGKILFTKYHERMCGLYLRDNRLLSAQVLSDTSNRIGSVYIGKIKNVVKNIDAYFLEIAEGEICFLAKKDATNPLLLNRKFDGRILEGDEILVQISKEAQKTKQASVTADISLSNEYVAISMGSRRIGYSGKLDKSLREEIKGWLTQAELLQENEFQYSSSGDIELSLGLIIRTQANDCTETDLMQNIHMLTDEFMGMVQTARHRTCFSCIRQARESFVDALEQLAYPNEYDEIVTDDAELYHRLNIYLKENNKNHTLRFYEDSVLSLSKLYSLEQKMDTALNTRIWLKSGGYLIIEHTEALTVIDVNTGKYEARMGSHNTNASATYEMINFEAAEEIALQLRLRNLSGIIIVDFINMNSKESEEKLLERLRELVRKDRIKTNIVDITPLGLVEITRQKRNKPLREQLDF